MRALADDFISFSYNGIHSSDLGIVRVSDGSRFNEDLLPSSQDKTVQVPGGDGTYYFGSYFTQKPITLSYAFDRLTESQIEYIKELFGDKKIHPLVFDERPYKTYWAKVTGSSTLKYVPFGDRELGRIYKGEGTVTFTCYQPYAICNKKFLDDYITDFDNVEEWAEASGLLQSGNDVDILQNGEIKVYNPGVKDSNWIATFTTESEYFEPCRFTLQDKVLEFQGAEAKSHNKLGSISYDERITFNSKTGLIEGWYASEFNARGVATKYLKSGNLYNEYVSNGSFFDIPVTITKTLKDGQIEIEKNTLIMTLTDLKDQAFEEGLFESLKYDYYYF